MLFALELFVAVTLPPAAMYATSCVLGWVFGEADEDDCE